MNKNNKRSTWKYGQPKTAFISGGGSGLGLNIAKELIQEGANIAIFDHGRSDDLVQYLNQLIVHNDQRIERYIVDIADPKALDKAMNSAVSEVGVPDFALNSAGILRTATFSKLSYETFEQVINVNLIGSRNFAFSVLQHMQSGGHLILVASLAGIVGSYTHAAYAASKFGVVGLAEVLRLELKLKGISVSVICPGEIDTPLLKQERIDGSPITEMMNDFAGVLSVEDAINGIMKGLKTRQYMITPGFRAKLTRAIARKFTTLFHLIADSKLAKAYSKFQSK
ncbi:SDR family NAD(P)-dependent oxidoreductase [Alkalimarinus alittae]|uniref:SDR family NAD(P)-dependent oxidoreductase n=1 Tax=Alkalimarinus alittae TaxID=2961619 RepID=A0ABY6MZU9_9ALTE|nr:SDR family NAD(P)-dependent oxidoreductase [Alkalimarinus alittae]UZE95367.1 SDR family NAD(P)-dependent oxidoreductase [Alkalimarinus alittae]